MAVSYMNLLNIHRPVQQLIFAISVGYFAVFNNGGALDFIDYSHVNASSFHLLLLFKVDW